MTDDLVSTLEGPGAFDALTKLRPGEPYFALIGRDRLAPQLVMEWAHQNRARTHAEQEAGQIDADRVDYELRKSTQAEAVAWAMQAYKRGEPVDSPPVDRNDTEHYSGFQIDPVTAARDKRRSDLALASSRIHNSVAELNDVAELLRAHGQIIHGNEVRRMVKALKRIADRVVPQRQIIETTNEENEDDV